MWNNKNCMVMLSACALCLPGAPSADERIQVHGFVSQGAAHTDANEVGGNSQDGLGLDMRELGVNVSYRPNGDWLFSGQALARWAGNTDDGGLRLDYAFADRTLASSEASRVGLQVGKVKNPYGLYNMTRDVAHTRPGILMPQSIYPDQMRDFFLAAPGISLYGSHESGFGNLSWQISALRPEVDEEILEHVFMLRALPGHFAGRNSWLGQVLLDVGGSWHLGLSVGEMNMAYRPGALPPVDELAGRHSLPTWVLSLEHNSEDWSFIAEYGQTTVRARNYSAPTDDNTTEAWYVQATRRFGEGWQAYLRYDVLYFDRHDKDGTQFASDPTIVFLGIPAYSRFAKDWVLGLRHDRGPWAFSGEFHRVEGTAWLSPMDTPYTVQERGWHMFLLQAAYRF